MARRATEASIDALVRDAMEGVVRRASVAIARAVADLAALHLSEQLEAGVARAGRQRVRRAVPARGGRVRADISKWAADRRARRVPNFVIEMTGLKTKKQIVQKFGENVVFEKGKAAPKAR
jgi:hypothetical protein